MGHNMRGHWQGESEDWTGGTWRYMVAAVGLPAQGYWPVVVVHFVVL